MKHLCITYHMEKNHGTASRPKMETAETCITLPMQDHIADDILKNGEDSQYMSRMAVGYVTAILSELSEIQGYHYSGFCSAEEVELKAIYQPVPVYPELRNYDAEGNYTIPSTENKGFAITSGQESNYEFTFYVSGRRYCCRLSARDLDSAYGKFFKHHLNIKYSMIACVEKFKPNK